MSLFPDIDRQLDVILAAVQAVARQQTKDRSDIFSALNKSRQLQEKSMATLDEILSDVTDETSMIDGLGTMIAGLRQQVADAVAKTGLSTDDQAKIDAIFAAAEANKARIATALGTGVTPA